MIDPTVVAPRRSPLARTCRAIAHHPAFEPLRVQRNRRLLVVAHVTVLVAMPLVGWLTGRLWVVLILFVPFAAGGILLGGATRGLLDRPVASLDERERHIRLTIFPEPYSVGATFGLVAGMVTITAFDRSDPVMMGMLVPTVSGLFLIPVMVLAWRMPDELDEEA